MIVVSLFRFCSLRNLNSAQLHSSPTNRVLNVNETEPLIYHTICGQTQGQEVIERMGEQQNAVFASIKLRASSTCLWQRRLSRKTELKRNAFERRLSFSFECVWALKSMSSEIVFYVLNWMIFLTQIHWKKSPDSSAAMRWIEMKAFTEHVVCCKNKTSRSGLYSTTFYDKQSVISFWHDELTTLFLSSVGIDTCIRERLHLCG